MFSKTSFSLEPTRFLRWGSLFWFTPLLRRAKQIALRGGWMNEVDWSSRIQALESPAARVLQKSNPPNEGTEIVKELASERYHFAWRLESRSRYTGTVGPPSDYLLSRGSFWVFTFDKGLQRTHSMKALNLFTRPGLLPMSSNPLSSIGLSSLGPSNPWDGKPVIQVFMR
jgi:hypothetical protein